MKLTYENPCSLLKCTKWRKQPTACQENENFSPKQNKTRYHAMAALSLVKVMTTYEM